MLCQKCGKYNATTHIHKVVNGVVTQMNLCSACAGQQGYTNLGNNGIMDMLISMFGDTVNAPASVKETRCDCCGSSFTDIASAGKVGCSKCYSVFKNQLLPYIKRVHGSTVHMGKKPNRAEIVLSKPDILTDLRKKLNELVKNENYEEAAIIRDEIKKYQEENGNE